MHPRLSKLLLTTTALSAFVGLVWLAAPPAAAGPEGGTVVGGAATIAGQGSASVIVNQSSGSAVINWHTFKRCRREVPSFAEQLVGRSTA